MENNFSLEDALHQLDDIVRRLESGELSLDETVALFEQGQTLVRQCEKDLDAKELRIQQIMEDGSLKPLHLSNP